MISPRNQYILGMSKFLDDKELWEKHYDYLVDKELELRKNIYGETAELIFSQKLIPATYEQIRNDFLTVTDKNIKRNLKTLLGILNVKSKGMNL